MKYLKLFENFLNEGLKVEVWEDEDGDITVIENDDPRKDWALGDNPKLIRTIEGDDWNDCMRQHHELMGWEPYKSFIDDEDEYDPYSYEGCGCCPVCTGEKDCECGCPECNYPEELEQLEEAKKSGVTASLKKKSKASGIPMGILRKVFAKGMQAWNAGHRPGVAQHQWGMGRVNSFITGSGGARKADAALWTKAKAAKARKKKRK